MHQAGTPGRRAGKGAAHKAVGVAFMHTLGSKNETCCTQRECNGTSRHLWLSCKDRAKAEGRQTPSFPLPNLTRVAPRPSSESCPVPGCKTHEVQQPERLLGTATGRNNCPMLK